MENRLSKKCNQIKPLTEMVEEEEKNYCGLDPILTGENDPFYQSGACPRHDELMTKKEARPVAIAARFAYDAMNTAVINTAKAVYSVGFVIPYILIGGLGGLIRDVYKRGKK